MLVTAARRRSCSARRARESSWSTALMISPSAMRRGGGGAIVNVSSISALWPRGLTTYSVSKGAVIALTRAMAVDHGREGIRVNCVAPGPVYTPMVYGRGMSDAVRDRRRQASALGIEGTGWDIGHVLVVDGGTTLTAPERDSR